MDYKEDLITCDACGGTGAVPDDDGNVIICEQCKGEGVI